MGDSGNNRRNLIVDLILALIIIALVYFLFQLVGGDWSLSSLSGGPDPFGNVLNGLKSIGEGIQGMFGNLVP